MAREQGECVSVLDAPVMIAGGGIGGLTAALALARRGIAVHLLEAAPQFAELGAGLQLGPNGTRVLAALGLGDGLRRLARRPQALILKDGLTGGTLARIPLGDTMEARYGAPYLVMPRHALHNLLLDAVRAEPRITITCGQRVESCNVIEDDIFIGGSGGSRPLEPGGLIAADGVHSALRRQLFPEARIAPSGRTALRGLVPAGTGASGGAEDAVCVWMGPDAHLVHYPIGPEGALNMVAVVGDGTLPAPETSIGAAHLAAVFRGWSEEACELIGAAGGWLRWPLFTMLALAEWSRGPVTLLGDAAHPMLPFLASGAVMAIEDAAVLADEVARSPQDCASAFGRYQRRRIARLRQVQAAVARTGEIYHMTGVMRAARNIALATLPTRALLARNDWLYGFRA